MARRRTWAYAVSAIAIAMLATPVSAQDAVVDE